MADRIVTIGSGKTYSTIALAISGEDDFQAGEDNIIFEIDAGQYSAITISGFTTTSSHKLIFRAVEGAFHNFTREQGVRVVNTTDWLSSIYSSGIGYIEFINIACSNSASTNNVGFAVVATTITLNNCFIYDCNYMAVSPGDNCNIINCAIVNCTLGVDIYYGTTYLYNCIIINNTTGLSLGNWRTGYIKNCYFSNTTNFNVDPNCTLNVTTCASSDGSQGTTNISLANCSFTNSTAGSEDVSIGSDSDLIDVGTDLSGDSTYPFDTDGYGNSRGEDWDIGVMEYVPASGGGSLVGASALVGGGVLCGQGNLIN
jgi:hypothetical protein